MSNFRPSSPVAHPCIAVVGGGITGLAAAHRIRELMPDCEVTLFEAGPRVGGVLETIERDGFLIERSADNFLTRLPAAVDLCRRLGIDQGLLSTDETRRRAFVVRGGRLVAIPQGFFLMSPRKLGPLLSSKVLSVPGKLRLLAEPMIPRRDPSARDESVASFARRRLGREAFERLVQPLVAGIYTAEPEKLSMAATMPEFFAQERDHGSLLLARHQTDGDSGEALSTSGARYGLFAAPTSGMTELVRAIVASLPPGTIRLNTQATAVEAEVDDRWRLTTTRQDEPSAATTTTTSTASFEAIILALPAYSASALLLRALPALAAELEAIEYAGCAVVSFGFNRNQIGHALGGFGFVVPRVEKRHIIAGSFASQKFPGRAPEHSVLIRTFIGGALQPELLERSDDELRSLALDELRDLLGISGQPIVCEIARWPRSMPQYHVGHLDRVARIEKLASEHPTLALAGNAYDGVGIPQCVASGEMAAEQIIKAVGALRVP